MTTLSTGRAAIRGSFDTAAQQSCHDIPKNGPRNLVWPPLPRVSPSQATRATLAAMRQ
jgi:hypothetical protein